MTESDRNTPGLDDHQHPGFFRLDAADGLSDMDFSPQKDD